KTCLSTVRPSLPSALFSHHHTAPTEIYTLSLHDALPISSRSRRTLRRRWPAPRTSARCRPRPATFTPSPLQPCCTATSRARRSRSEEHTSELQSRSDLVCRLLLEKKKKIHNKHVNYKPAN